MFKNLVLLFVILFLVSSNLFATSNGSDIIYGVDNREDIVNIKDIKLKNLASAVAARIDRWSYHKEDTLVSFDQLPIISDPFVMNLCKDEKFASQPVLSDCSGFLIGEDILVTAGHCMTAEDTTVRDIRTSGCKYYDWIFDYEVDKNEKFSSFNRSSDNIYKCENVIFATLTDEDDFAIIKLDRKVKGRTPLKFRSSRKIKLGEDIFVIGHPSGLPKKISMGAKVIENKTKEFFTTNLDTFGGNSGSPVFNANTLEVEGILVRGRTDYRMDSFEGESCMRVNHCDDNGKNCIEVDPYIDGEEVTRITELKKILKSLK